MTNYLELFSIFVGSAVFSFLLEYFVPIVIVALAFTALGVIFYGKSV